MAPPKVNWSMIPSFQATQEELDLYMESDEANYQIFSDSKTAMRRAIAEQVIDNTCTNYTVIRIHG